MLALSPLVIACYAQSIVQVRKVLPESPVKDYTLTTTGQSAVVATLLGAVDMGRPKSSTAEILDLLRREGYWSIFSHRTAEVGRPLRNQLVTHAHSAGKKAVAEILTM